MACSICGTESRPDFRFCGECGAPVAEVANASPSEGLPAIRPESTRGSTLRILFVLIWVAILTFARERFSAESVGEWFGTLLFPLLLAFLCARAWRRDSRREFSYWFLGLGIMLPTLANHKSLTNLSHADFVRELVGTKPLEDNLPTNQREMASVTREFFSQMGQYRISHDQKVAELQPDLAMIYTPNSFKSRETIQKAIVTVDKGFSLDRETSDMFQKWPVELKARLDKTNLSEDDKTKFMTSFMASFNSSDFISARKKMIDVEEKWDASTDDLYEFALQNLSKISVEKDKIVINDATIRQQFNAKYKEAGHSQDEYLAAAKAVNDVREAKMKNSGITPADLGMAK
jgi:hypothetical protein